ncbi:response regulator transcription factor [Pseudoalteromonas sp. SWXJZ94C]|uniref:LuxR C-terminal-related transcriptional regulator n=1 Tax=Pseudoalteromonas sp. SWXJZ94C TaxID=2792065 RepID=UPI0018CEDCE8|nr:LuxR C-terminal-related transcriptional regulator [Pseudoalteromonas sp. SWXJZ94C]MBH0058086.1 response regulator transcription factor [Pseudoalteromonas sp. SWXJZ94C]
MDGLSVQSISKSTQSNYQNTLSKMYEAALMYGPSLFQQKLSEQLNGMINSSCQIWAYGNKHGPVGHFSGYYFHEAKSKMRTSTAVKFLQRVASFSNLSVTLLSNDKWSEVLCDYPDYQHYRSPIIITLSSSDELQSIILFRLSSEKEFCKTDIEVLDFLAPHLDGAIEMNIKEFIRFSWKVTRNQRAVFDSYGELIGETEQFDSFYNKLCTLDSRFSTLSNILASSAIYNIDCKLKVSISGLLVYKAISIIEYDFRIESLSTTEWSVCKLLLLTYSNQEIKSTLGISVKTVEAHIKQIMNKLGTSSRAEVISYLYYSGYDLIESNFNDELVRF